MMKISRPIPWLGIFCVANFCQAQPMFRGDANHSGVYSGPEPRQFHRDQRQNDDRRADLDNPKNEYGGCQNVGARDAGRDKTDPGEDGLQHRNSNNTPRHGTDGASGKPQELFATCGCYSS